MESQSGHGLPSVGPLAEPLWQRRVDRQKPQPAVLAQAVQLDTSSLQHDNAAAYRRRVSEHSYPLRPVAACVLPQIRTGIEIGQLGWKTITGSAHDARGRRDHCVAAHFITDERQNWEDHTPELHPSVFR